MAKVAVVRTSVETVFSDIQRAMDLAGVRQALDPRATTILKDNISWHFPFPGANTTPWQLEGTIRALRTRGLRRSGLRPEQDRRHRRVQGRGPQPLRADLQALRRPRPLQLQGRGHDVGATTGPRRRCTCSTTSSPRASTIPDYFFGKNIVHLPTVKCHIYTTTTGAMKNAFGGLLNTKRHYTHIVDPRDAGRSAGDPEGDPHGPVRGDGRHHRRQRARAAHDVSR